MSDALYPNDHKTYEARTRAVIRDGVSRLYFIYEWSGHAWEPVGRGYEHSTSAYAKLGRIVNKESQAELKHI